MARDSALGLKRSDVQAAIQAAGMDLGGDFAAAFNAGMIQGVKPFEGVLPQIVGGTSTLQTFEQSGLESGDGFAGAFANAGGWKGMMSGAAAAVGGFATGGWKAGVMSMVQTAASALPPGMAQAAQAAIAAAGAIWNAIKRPSEEEIAARKSFAGIHDSAVELFGDTAAYSEHVNELVAQGWDRTLAETVAGFESAAAAAGVSHADAVALYAQYQQAVQDGNTELVASIEETYNEWASAAEESAAAQEAAAREAAAAAEAAWQASSSAAVSAYREAESEATAAYDSTYEAAIEAGAGEEEATRKALEASIEASEKVLAARGEEFARIAAFDAAMALGADATQAERAAAAESAAKAATASWDAAMGAVAASDKAATDAMKGDWTGPEGVKQETEEAALKAREAWETEALEIERLSGAMTAEMKADLGSVESSAKGNFRGIVAAAQDAANEIEFGSIWPRMTHEMAADMARMADSSIGSIGRVVSAAAGAEVALDKLEKKRSSMSKGFYPGLITFAKKSLAENPLTMGATGREFNSDDPDNPYVVGDFGPGYSGRARGGPVSAGRAYMVGERGPETFVPSASGAILPNGLTAESIGAAVARALQRNPPVVSQSPVTDSVMRAWPRQQALRGYA